MIDLLEESKNKTENKSDNSYVDAMRYVIDGMMTGVTVEECPHCGLAMFLPVDTHEGCKLKHKMGDICE